MGEALYHHQVWVDFHADGSVSANVASCDEHGHPCFFAGRVTRKRFPAGTAFSSEAEIVAAVCPGSTRR